MPHNTYAAQISKYYLSHVPVLFHSLWTETELYFLTEAVLIY